ncbi:coA-disulfide reductase [Candidatus Aquiluna sp. IMCC13023]|uniref:FAD-dependent oxidoreductase n=1 Tax=Candidatus Aquiluna sp. IMCC13023 TaxID=1081644 RepID=UPI00025B2FE5|nr:FAD-dependent oxidoreductase [Candidatus Aquiluna sp. IMCC13023]EIC92117.1 coA-disulfide reductase [Candidatus Aquiluna sp. IMCC13023]
MKVLIVGGVAGGMSAATRLRRLKEDAEIIVFEQGPHVSYANCGLPYHIGEVIEAEESLLLQTPESLHARFNLDVRVNNRVTKIDRENKQVTVANLKDNTEYEEGYDQLVLSTGAKPRMVPIPGLERALVLRDVQDAVKIKALVDTKQIKSAAIIGAGFIGVELAENLRHRGIKTTIVEFRDNILPQFDPEMIEPMQKVLIENGIELALSAETEAVHESTLTLKDGRVIDADLVVAAIGVVADHKLAVDAGLEIGSAGGIVVDDQMRTSDENIFAVGDAAQKLSALTGQEQMIWLANLANRHGRLVADVIAGETVAARPSIGTGIIGAFGMAAALTGLTESLAKRMNIAHKVIHLHPSSHAGYYPGAEAVSLKVLFDPESGKLLGAQGIGRDGIDKRIDVIATAIYAGLKIDDLMNLELSYAPAFGSAKDAVNQAGYVGNNIFTGKTESVQFGDLAEKMSEGALLVDVRSESEHVGGSIPGSLLIPIDTLRENLNQLAGREIIVHCGVGQRGHTAVQLLRGHGINAKNLDGGYTTWKQGIDARDRAAKS